MARVAVTCVNVHFVDTVAISGWIGPIVSVPANLFSAHYLHLETRDAVATVIHVPVDANSVRSAIA